jgi:hypothetical protein
MTSSHSVHTVCSAFHADQLKGYAVTDSLSARRALSSFFLQELSYSCVAWQVTARSATPACRSRASKWQSNAQLSARPSARAVTRTCGDTAHTYASASGANTGTAQRARAPVREDEAILVEDECVGLARVEECLEVALECVEHPVADVRASERAVELDRLLAARLFACKLRVLSARHEARARGCCVCFFALLRVAWGGGPCWQVSGASHSAQHRRTVIKPERTQPFACLAMNAGVSTTASTLTLAIHVKVRGSERRIPLAALAGKVERIELQELGLAVGAVAALEDVRAPLVLLQGQACYPGRVSICIKIQSKTGECRLLSGGIRSQHRMCADLTSLMNEAVDQ